MRKWLNRASFVLLATILGGCCHKSAVAVPVIDVHTHAFNAHDLPISGILSAKGVPDDVADSLSKVINWWTSDDSDSRSIVPADEASPPKPSDDLSQVTKEIRAKSHERSRTIDDSLLAPLSADQRARLMQFADTGGGARDIGARMAKTADESDVETVARALARAGMPPGETPADARGIFDDIRGYIRFLGVVTGSHYRLSRQMSDREYPQVRLFVHHMMDMAAAYADQPATSFDRQIDAMQRLDASMNGKLVHFVAYDPFRRGDALDYVKRGLAAGAIGIKFYPPSGYSAAGNLIEPEPQNNPSEARRWRSRYGGNPPFDAAAIDSVNRSLFQYCVENDVPIFTQLVDSKLPHATESRATQSIGRWCSRGFLISAFALVTQEAATTGSRRPIQKPRVQRSAKRSSGWF
jgi:hypothetical protein